ncbi:SpoIIE family protein phosphatase [Marivirga sp.]|uniref:SpoIIE family protein phosphatase n=1 Tax=Marivirga sp. TaxID=2018662 RepID=UPI002D80479F|nr:SpoIIE family protein phosphatase [Marivirga sp.]HET8859754.1 SpoIIE family protein phosphatase [Marivirga sp.]
MKQLHNHILLIITLLLYTITVSGQSQKAKKFEIDEFLGERNFISAAQGNDLIIYFNTTEGILSYNGHEFQEIDLPNALKGIQTIHSFKQSIIISDKYKTYQYFLDHASVVTLLNKPTIEFTDHNNQLWFLTDNELFVLDGEQVKKIHQASSKEEFQSISIDSINSIIGHTNGLTILEKGEESKTIGTFLNPRKITKGDTSLFILSKDAIFNFTKNKIVQLFKEDNTIKDFYIDGLGKTWFINSQNILMINDAIVTKTFKNEDIKGDVTGNKLFIDAENNIWVLGLNNLIKITQNNAFTKLTTTDLNEVYFGSQGNILIKQKIITAKGIFSEENTVEIPELELPLNYQHALEKNNKWLIVLNQSIYSWQQENKKLKLVKKNSLYTPLLLGVDGVFIAKNRKGQLFKVNQDFSPISKISVSLTKQSIIENSRIISINKANLISIIDTTGSVQKSFQLSDSIKIKKFSISDDGIWYTENNNLFYGDFQKKTIERINLPLENNLQKEIILNIFDDKDGNLWVSVKDRLLRFPYDPTAQKISLQNPIRYTTEDYVNSTYFTKAKKDSQGRIWFTNSNGLSIYNQRNEMPNLVPPSIHLEAAFAYNINSYNEPTDTIDLLNDKKNLSSNSIIVIEPMVINHLNHHKSSVAYRNISINQAESRINAGERIILTNLPSGINSISLKAINDNGIESSNEYILNLKVTPPIWQRNWFYITSILSVLLLGFVGYKTVISIKNSRARELEDELHKGLEELEKKSHLQVLKAERLKQLNELITSQKSELEKKNKQIESQKYELSLTNQQIKKQKDLLEETGSKLTSSINYAKRIQNALMSTEVEIKKAFTDSFVYFSPRDMVSGDFFWFNKVKNEKDEELLILAAVDCTGHGVPGAIVSVVGMNLLNNITKLKKIYDPGNILTEMNSDIISDLRQDETQVNDGMDMTIITYNTVTKQLLFAGAKNPLMYVQDNELIRIKGDKYAIGGQQRGDDRAFITHEIDLKDGKQRTFYLFSDGYQDQFGGEKGFKYLVGNFKKLLLSIHDKGVLEQKTILHEEIEEWKNGYPQTDDILVIGFKL